MTRLRLRAEDQTGFTLVEVLVVMLIMGILAGIAIPGFISQRDRGNDTNAKSIARAAVVAIESYGSDNLGAYEGVNGTILHAIDSSIPASINAAGIPDCSYYGVCWVVTTPADATPTGTTFSVVKFKTGTITSDCSAHGKGGCPANGDWFD